MNYRLKYYQDIDVEAKSIVIQYLEGKPITDKMLKTIISIYHSAKVEQEFKDEFFESAYHSPITGELEFYIARIIYHLSLELKKNWKIFLRRQEKHCVPDIRLIKANKTFAIIEVKAKAGWIQPFLSPERYKNDKEKYINGKSTFDPEGLIQRSKNQLRKYYETYNIKHKDIYLLLPTFALVHRKKYKTTLEEYYDYFSKTSKLPKENLILLSSNKRLDLSRKSMDLSPTEDFENLLEKLLKY